MCHAILTAKAWLLTSQHGQPVLLHPGCVYWATRIGLHLINSVFVMIDMCSMTDVYKIG